MSMEMIAETKVKVVVRRGEETVEELVKLGDIFSIDDTDLTTEMARQAGLYAYFAVQMAHAERDHAVSIRHKDTEYAAADEAYRRPHHHNGKKYTEAVIKSMVVRDTEYDRAVVAEIDARHNYQLLRTICRALEMRATMLVSVGAHQRHELDMTGMNIRDRKYQSAISDVRKAVTAARDKHGK